ncbi:hypothetical protein BO86DRAFT_442409 [Aspergillus japonicus CBS 114.51]|uniref:Uncharacterized protein n=2 Tax=Aspergillus TaxID=5052 RepID=A0A2V5GU72_ASPV1|nr:hypothetical protein BO86DRAFT_442409 [Aspergillus japonicus CBS 114.51]PYI14491.1 hypothetical protein BO99DRAFT_394592 [Aspergillus violaceofuscus CBS 115571]RAH76788.1 hypothetical protein BO86DRAFT_442409 [Aspergillus japonicus CBS 114.51]
MDESATSGTRPYYSHLIQLNKDNGAGDWHRWLVVAASRSDMITFFKGLQKYTKQKDAKITEVKPVNLAWWNFDAREGFNVRELVCQIYRLNPSWYGNIKELNDSRGKICVTVQDDAGGRRWPILPPQDTSIAGIFSSDDDV